MDDKFYSPLSVTGYLTPLQRKKLREKRGLLITVSVESTETKPRMAKRKRETKSNVPSKKPKIIKHKETPPQIQCSLAKIICKTNDISKEKKFFKTSSPSRLERTNFSMPLIFKKSLFFNLRKNKEEIHKKPSFRDLSFNDGLSHNINSEEKCSNVDAPCVIKINECSDVTEDSLQKVATDKETEHLLTSFNFEWPSDEILLKRQIEARANIKKQKLQKESLEGNNKEDKQESGKPLQKLYPVFYLAKRKQSESQQNIKRIQKNSQKRLKSLDGGEQMMIDAGQKKFGAQICSTCNMIYSIGVEEDETLHSNYHDTYLINLKFPGWKEENVIGEYADGRIIMIRRNEQSFKIKKLEDVLTIANRDLGFPISSLPSKPDLTFLLFISSTKQVVGCVVAEPVSCASRVLLLEDNESLPSIKKEFTWRIGNWYSSSETVPAVCGINRIWVAHNYRRHKVASRMIDCLRCHFIHGHIIGITELAFTDPSPDGREFAAAYTRTDNFLVYK